MTNINTNQRSEVFVGGYIWILIFLAGVYALFVTGPKIALDITRDFLRQKKEKFDDFWS